MRLAIVFAIALSVGLPAVAAAPVAQVDHILLGIDDLDRGMEQFEKLTGVRPVYGGKHPRGTHNALVSLGDGTYLEILALQPNVALPTEYEDLKKLNALTPIGWAVSSKDSDQLRSRLTSAGLAVSEASPGSRTTPAGKELSWQTFGLEDAFEEAPFFIVWSPQSAHPSTTSPAGCRLQRWRVAGPHLEKLEQLRTALDLRVEVAEAPATTLRLSLNCPKGAVEFH